MHHIKCSPWPPIFGTSWGNKNLWAHFKAFFLAWDEIRCSYFLSVVFDMSGNRIGCSSGPITANSGYRGTFRLHPSGLRWFITQNKVWLSISVDYYVRCHAISRGYSVKDYHSGSSESVSEVFLYFWVAVGNPDWWGYEFYILPF